MADVKKLQTRIALKYDSYANWTDDTKEGLGANLVLLKGELGICAIEDKAQGAQTAPTVLFKVGDGTTPFKTLKWASALAADVYAWAKASDVVVEGKALKFKDAAGNVIKEVAIPYVTETEVKAITDPLAARITSLEGKFTGTDSVGAQIDALDTRIDTFETTVENTYAKKVDVYTKTEIDNMELITAGDIDTICSSTITVADDEVTF